MLLSCCGYLVPPRPLPKAHCAPVSCAKRVQQQGRNNPFDNRLFLRPLRGGVRAGIAGIFSREGVPIPRTANRPRCRTKRAVILLCMTLDSAGRGWRVCCRNGHQRCARGDEGCCPLHPRREERELQRQSVKPCRLNRMFGLLKSKIRFMPEACVRYFFCLISKA